MSRLLFEAVKIESLGLYNSKSEWRRPAKTRLQVEEPEWVSAKKKVEVDQRDIEEKQGDGEAEGEAEVVED